MKEEQDCFSNCIKQGTYLNHMRLKSCRFDKQRSWELMKAFRKLFIKVGKFHLRVLQLCSSYIVRQSEKKAFLPHITSFTCFCFM